jgi:hypothetical protein
VYFTNWGFTLWGIFAGKLVFGQSQLETEEGMMKKAQDKEQDGIQEDGV